jgi:hypothetical protein
VNAERERRESVKFGRAFLIAAAVSTPAWVLVAAGLHLVAVFS